MPDRDAAPRGMLDGHADEIAGLVEIVYNVHRDLARFLNGSIGKFEKRGVRVAKVFDRHGLNLRSKKALWTVSRSGSSTPRRLRPSTGTLSRGKSTPPSLPARDSPIIPATTPARYALVHDDSPGLLSRRSFVGWLAAIGPAIRGIRMPAFIRRRAEIDVALARALASAILPAELGAAGAQRAADAFVAWARGYRTGAELSHGYGNARIRNAGTDPSIVWAQQLQFLDADARRAHGRSFAAVSVDERRTIVRTQLERDRVTNFGNVASASHVTLALLAHFYASPEATDLCYEAHIGKNACRPLSASPSQPVPLRRAGSGT